MIQSLSDKYKRLIAWPMLIIFYIDLIIPFYVNGENSSPFRSTFLFSHPIRSSGLRSAFVSNLTNGGMKNTSSDLRNSSSKTRLLLQPSVNTAIKKADIGGPSTPEATSFKAAGSDNLVNLFTGDFSYSIPLIDVGGYPVNLFYNGGITMEQEASWVGLGWNINPGTVTRNMRGIPDDFDGTDMLVQSQNVKPNRTWGGEIGVDGEVIGFKAPRTKLSLGFSYNNYLGPALDIGTNLSLSIASLQAFGSEKMAPANLGLSLNLGAKLSSRSGLTFSPSLNANVFLTENNLRTGIGLSTAYNSRSGIRNLTLNSEMSFYKTADNTEPKYKDATDIGASIGSSTFSFAKPSYMPVLRMPMENANYSGQIEFGAGLFGLRGSLSGSGYYIESGIPDESKVVAKPLVGFIYSENAVSNPNAVMDFNRVNDAEVTPNTPIISAPQYTYDIFSIQGEGTGGSIRAYRGDLGFMRDNVTVSKDKDISIGFDIAPPGHWGGNWNSVSTPTKVGGWEDGDNTLQQTLIFKHKQNTSSFENVYFKNPGEATVSNNDALKRIGMDNLVRFQLTGSNVNPRLESKLEQFNKHTATGMSGINILNTGSLKREKRTQVTTMLTGEEASKIGLEKQIRNYTGTFDIANNLLFDTISRNSTSSYRKPHHISEIDVLEQNGMRYVYGIPVYSVKQKDFTFSVEELPDPSTNLVACATDEPGINSHTTSNNSKLDGYVQTQETPAYASSFLITGLLSPDYVDVTGNGITEDDLGNAVKFNYSKSDGLHKWRTPRNNNSSQALSAHFNEGVRSEKKDNKATISYGEREAWYLNSIESKSMIAIFKTASRSDAKGVVSDMDGKINSSENVNKKLTQIDLYTKAEIKSKGIVNAKPLKTVLFYYAIPANSLCNGTPDNLNGGKLTLDSIMFSYNGQTKLKKEKYVFNYGNRTSSTDNPGYAYNASDRWGTYKSPAENPNGLSNIDYPYTSDNKVKCDEYAGAWSLKKILLPSGGQMEVQYEADDYAYTQNRRSCNMLNIYGLGKTKNYVNDNGLYNLGQASEDNYYVYIKLPQALNSANTKQEIYSKYLEGINQLAFKLQVNMPKGAEPLTVYAEYDDYGLCLNSQNRDYIYIHLKPVDGKSPLAKSAIGFLTENIPGQAFPGYDAEVNNLSDFIHLATDMLGSILTAFKNVDEQMRAAPKARTIQLDKSFIRLDNPWKNRYGGGVRVKRVTVKDNWNAMTGQYNSIYGQDYDYTTTEKINGKDTIISSGVASYEPGIGSEENPFRQIVSFSNKLPLASAQYGAIEMPILEGLYPSPCVGYSKVTVRSIHRKGTHGDSSLRSAIGKQVTEFYTAKDYPTFSTYTPMATMDYNKNPFFSFFYKEIINRRTISQGFLVETNDMHGKMKSQAAYSESDENTPLSYSLHSYKNTGTNGLNDLVNFVYKDEGGTVHNGNMGIDAELMTDIREFSVKSDGLNGQAQLDIFPFLLVIWTVFTVHPLKTYAENRYRAVTCTKLINYHAIEDTLVVMDKGSLIKTNTIAYDAEIGTPLVTQTSNEFNDPVYNVNYPAYWAYSGMEPAYKNIGLEFLGVNFNDGRIISGVPDLNIFESGDELFITKQNSGSSSCIGESSDVIKLWAFDKNKDTTALTVPVKDLIFIDSIGRPFTKNGVDFKIVRSGKRNYLGLSVSNATCMKNPIQNNKLIINNADNIISASAIEFKEKWQTDNDVIKKLRLVNTSSGPNLVTNGDFSNGNTGFTSEYTYYPTPYNEGHEGTYTIGTNPQAWDPGLVNGSDHTTGTGNMLLVNGAAQPVTVWSQTVQVQPNANYIFTIWTRQTFYLSSPELQFKVNGTQIGSNYYVTGTNLWTTFFSSWNSGNNTTATISIVDINTVGDGNDFAIDDISFALSTCGIPPTEIEDCNGYLEKSINPYLKGLIGNFKPYRNYVYYGNRIETNTSSLTAIRKNGYISNFNSYWTFNSANNLVPDNTNVNWVWNSEITRVNSKGQDLETKDALNRYTSSQYAFNKNLPVAVVQNSRFAEAMYEGFEDFNYEESINKVRTSTCNNDSYVSFQGLNNSMMVSDTAHSGRHALKINSNSSAIKTFKVKPSFVKDFSFTTKKDTTKHLVDAGGNFNIIQQSTGISTSLPTYSNFGMNGFQGFSVPYGLIKSFLYNTTQYFEITTTGNYTIRSRYEASSDFQMIFGTSYKWDIISVETGEIVPKTLVSVDHYTNSGEYLHDETNNVCLRAGKYEMSIEYGGTEGNYVCPDNQGCNQGIGYSYLVELNVPLISYKTLSSSNGCIFTKPISATDSMLNPTFSLVPGKRMQVSAWVHEDCTMPCFKTDYDKSNIEIWSGGVKIAGDTIKRTGTIIEGWQKIEGVFTLPSNASTGEIRFINTGDTPMYVDDIRIHPFNANMKSYVYDPQNLRLSAELDENNYATFYEYDEEGQLVRVKKETIQGIKTISETRNAKQKNITDIQ